MLNREEFTARLKQIMRHYQITPTQLSEKIGVQRSSISHILSGRNKPSLDFVMKVDHSFLEVDLHWLVSGKGDFPSLRKNTAPKLTFPEDNQVEDAMKKGNISRPKSDSSLEKKKMKRVIIFFSDGSFENYDPCSDYLKSAK